MAHSTACLVVVLVVRVGKHLEQSAVRLHALRGPVTCGLVLGFDLVPSLYQFVQRLTLSPGVLTALHSATPVIDLFLVLNGLLEQVWVAVLESNPFVLALEEAEVAAGPGAPLVVVRQADASLVEDALDSGPVDAVLPKGGCGDVRLGADIAEAVRTTA